ncbi:hypothetical protein BT69DRAFT_618083 [Atractiella rhizophila]|nr:hypothetical protein BT69DRAFT_618083 [Atractiella rhizophila]
MKDTNASDAFKASLAETVSSARPWKVHPPPPLPASASQNKTVSEATSVPSKTSTSNIVGGTEKEQGSRIASSSKEYGNTTLGCNASHPSVRQSLASSVTAPTWELHLPSISASSLAAATSSKKTISLTGTTNPDPNSVSRSEPSTSAKTLVAEHSDAATSSEIMVVSKKSEQESSQKTTRKTEEKGEKGKGAKKQKEGASSTSISTSEKAPAQSARPKRKAVPKAPSASQKTAAQKEPVKSIKSKEPCSQCSEQGVSCYKYSGKAQCMLCEIKGEECSSVHSFTIPLHQSVHVGKRVWLHEFAPGRWEVLGSPPVASSSAATQEPRSFLLIPAPPPTPVPENTAIQTQLGQDRELAGGRMGTVKKRRRIDEEEEYRRRHSMTPTAFRPGEG